MHPHNAKMILVNRNELVESSMPGDHWKTNWAPTVHYGKTVYVSMATIQVKVSFLVVLCLLYCPC